MTDFSGSSDLIDRRISVAPMMDWTDRHCRYFHRLISPNSLLYTEMVTTGAILKGDAHRFLRFNPEEKNVALQLGGSDPVDLREASKIAADYGYDEINLNVGCPSPRVQKGAFGACLMSEPDLVARCIDAMQQGVADAGKDIPVTLKTRLGIDDFDSYEFLITLLEKVMGVGCNNFTLHARKAWLNGLSPKENREIPKLDYDRVERVKADYPDCTIVINGGFADVPLIKEYVDKLDGVMVGRAAYQNPYILAAIEAEVFSAQPKSRHDIARLMVPYIERQVALGVPVKSVTRHILGLFQSVPGAKMWRRHLSTEAVRAEATPSVVLDALQLVPEDACSVPQVQAA